MKSKTNLASFAMRLDENSVQANLTHVLVYVSYGKKDSMK